MTTLNTQQALQKLLSRAKWIEHNDDALYDAIHGFYDISENLQPTPTEEQLTMIYQMERSSKYHLLCQLLAEVVNMDLMKTISTGVNPKLANRMYTRLGQIITQTGLLLHPGV